MTASEEEVKEWLKECARLRLIIYTSEPSFGNVGDSISQILYEKAFPPLHYFLEDRQKGTSRIVPDPERRAVPTSTPHPVPTTPRDEMTKVEVLRTRFEHASVMKEWRLRWNPDKKIWWGNVPTEALKEFVKYCMSKGLEVHH